MFSHRLSQARIGKALVWYNKAPISTKSYIATAQGVEKADRDTESWSLTSIKQLHQSGAVHGPCNCKIPVYSEDTDIISVSEEESKAPVMWVNNSAYCLTFCRERSGCFLLLILLEHV